MFLKSLFSSKKNDLTQGVFSTLAVDFHSHLIPGTDDGVQTMEEALSLIGQFYQLGFRKLITTPHIQQEFYTNTPEIILSGFQSLRAETKKLYPDLELEAAAEYMIDDGFEEIISTNQILSFGDGYVLVELTYFDPHPNLHAYIFDLQVAGYKVILAHPERYTYWYREPHKLEELKDKGVYFQLNTVSLSNHYGRDVRLVAEKLIEKGYYEFLGSDMHNQFYMDSLKRAVSSKWLTKLMSSGKLLNHQLL